MSVMETGSTSRVSTPGVYTLTENSLLGLNVGPIVSLHTFSIRNGRPEDAHSMLVKATISACWHWRPILNMPPSEAIRCVSAFVRVYHAQLTLTRPTGYTDDQIRKMAVVLGVSRAVTTAMYDIIDEDLIPGERAMPWAKWVRGTDGQIDVVPADNLDIPTRTAMTLELVLSERDLAAIPSIHMSAIGILPLQGYSLSVCGHHYLSDPGTQSMKAYEVVEKTHWKGTQVDTWFNTDIDKIRDVIWHKSCHPVSLTVKRRLAFSETVPKMLSEAGAGSAASRLPAIEPELRAAGSYGTLFQTVRPLIEMYGGKVEHSGLAVAVRTVHAFPADDPTLETGAILEGSVPNFVRSRLTALKWLSELLERNKDMAALCFGFYSSLAEANAVLSGGTATDTLKTSFSLKKLRSQSFASYVAGQQAHGDYVAARNAARAEGNFEAPKMKFNL